MYHLSGCLLFSLCFFAAVGHSYELDDFLSEQIQADMVYSPSRMEQSRKDVPGSVFVLTKEEIERFGVTNINDALLMGAGMVLADRGNETVISYHGLNTVLGRRVNILIDNIVVYDPTIARVPWQGLPVSLDEIDRIEISKSPAAAVYGANSFLAVINIYTEDPALAKKKITLSGDQKGYSGLYRHNSKLGSSRFNLSVSGDFNEGYDNDVTYGIDYRGERHNKRISFRAITDIDSTTVFKTNLILSEYKQDDLYPGINTVNTTDIEKNKSRRINGRLALEKTIDNHNLGVAISHYVGSQEQRVNSYCFPLAILTPQFSTLFNTSRPYAEAIVSGQIPSGGGLQADLALANFLALTVPLGAAARQPTCGSSNIGLDEDRTTLDFYDEILAQENLRLKLGIGFKEDNASSSVYFNNVDHSSNTVNGNVTIEYRPSKKITINFGAYGEDSDIVDETIFAPRMGINYHFSDRNTIRFAATRSYRLPDIFEQKAKWGVTVNNIESNLLGITDFRQALNNQAPGNLKPEKIDSFEIGYLFNDIEHGLSLDLKLFHDELSKLVDSYLNLYDFIPTNTGEVNLSGLEIDSKYALNRNWFVNTGLAYLDSDTDSRVERTTYKRLSGNIAIARVIGKYTISGAYRGASNTDNTGSQDVYRLGLQFAGKSGLKVLGYISYTPNPRVSYVDFAPFPLQGWRGDTLFEVSNNDKANAGLKVSYEW